MATFNVTVRQIEIKEHPNADALELAKIDDYLAIVAKGVYKTGDIVAYIPEQAIVPADIIEELNLTGRLAGKDRNRVKAIKLRGVLSQGLVYPAKPEWVLGQDVTEEMGIIKYEPPIPTSLSGEVLGYHPEITLNFDVENIKNYPDAIQEGQIVTMTEKLHGTCFIAAILPDRLIGDGDDQYEHGIYVSSKGLSSKGLPFKNNDINESNTYIMASKKYNLQEKYQPFANEQDKIVFVLGEIFGKGIQDLQYGIDGHELRIFDIALRDIATTGNRNTWLNWDTIKELTSEAGHDLVPVLYEGPFSKDKMLELTDGKDTISGVHIREGVVVRPTDPTYDERFGRVLMKSISEDYILRKNGTEYT